MLQSTRETILRVAQSRSLSIATLLLGVTQRAKERGALLLHLHSEQRRSEVSNSLSEQSFVIESQPISYTPDDARPQGQGHILELQADRVICALKVDGHAANLVEGIAGTVAGE